MVESTAPAPRKSGPAKIVPANCGRTDGLRACAARKRKSSGGIQSRFASPRRIPARR
jgi:hypothetical protein